MTTEKVFQLPDLPLVAGSDLQGLVRRLIEYADLTAIPAIADELMAQNRTDDLNRFKSELIDKAVSVVCEEGSHIRWRWLSQYLLNIFWIDFYGWHTLATVLKDRIEFAPNGTADQPTTFSNESSPLVMEETVQAGETVVIHYPEAVVRRLPNPTEEPK